MPPKYSHKYYANKIKKAEAKETKKGYYRVVKSCKKSMNDILADPGKSFALKQHKVAMIESNINNDIEWKMNEWKHFTQS